MDLKFTPSKASGTVVAPPSKSVAHRHLICAALARDKSVIHGIFDSEDMLATLSCISATGANVTIDGDVASIEPSKFLSLENAVFDCRESGSTLRFFLPIVLALGAKNVTFKGSERLIQRGVGEYKKVFEECDIDIKVCADCIKISGNLHSGNYTISGNVSSQYTTGLLFALSIVEGDSTLTLTTPIESKSYINITLDVMQKCGVSIAMQGENVFKISGNKRFDGGEYSVEGDWSNSAFWLALKAMGDDVEVIGLNRESKQGDRAIEDMLCALDKENVVLDLSDCPDLAPVLFAVSATKKGCRFLGTSRLKIKESDRGTAMAQELAKFGVNVQVLDNEVLVCANALKKPIEPIDGHNDHRIVMANAVLLCKTGGVLKGAEAVKKSYPHFFEDMKKLGVKIDEI